MNTTRLTPDQAVPKIRQFCSYQERCHKEVKEKLYSFGVYKADMERIISQMIEENYLNEERFAIHFAGGKFRMKKWGKMKIKQALKEKNVSDYCIKKAMTAIDPEDYTDTLNRVSEMKLRTLKSEKNIFIKKRKLQDYLLQKGYSFNEIKEVIDLYLKNP